MNSSLTIPPSFSGAWEFIRIQTVPDDGILQIIRIVIIHFLDDFLLVYIVGCHFVCLSFLVLSFF